MGLCISFGQSVLQGRCHLRPRLWLSCPRLTGWGPLGCCLGWGRGDTDGPAWLFLLLISGISPQRASSCQQARLSAGVAVRTSRCWVAPSRHGGRAGDQRKETGWHRLGTAPLSSANPSDPAKGAELQAPRHLPLEPFHALDGKLRLCFSTQEALAASAFP